MGSCCSNEKSVKVLDTVRTIEDKPATDPPQDSAKTQTDGNISDKSAGDNLTDEDDVATDHTDDEDRDNVSEKYERLLSQQRKIHSRQSGRSDEPHDLNRTFELSSTRTGLGPLDNLPDENNDLSQTQTLSSGMGQAMNSGTPYGYEPSRNHDPQNGRTHGTQNRTNGRDITSGFSSTSEDKMRPYSRHLTHEDEDSDSYYTGDDGNRRGRHNIRYDQTSRNSTQPAHGYRTGAGRPFLNQGTTRTSAANTSGRTPLSQSSFTGDRRDPNGRLSGTLRNGRLAGTDLGFNDDTQLNVQGQGVSLHDRFGRNNRRQSDPHSHGLNPQNGEYDTGSLDSFQGILDDDPVEPNSQQGSDKQSFRVRYQHSDGRPHTDLMNGGRDGRQRRGEQSNGPVDPAQRKRDMEIQKLQEELTRKRNKLADSHLTGLDIKKMLAELTQLQQTLLDLLSGTKRNGKVNGEVRLNKTTSDFLANEGSGYDRGQVMGVLDDHFERHRDLLDSTGGNPEFKLPSNGAGYPSGNNTSNSTWAREHGVPNGGMHSSYNSHSNWQPARLPVSNSRGHQPTSRMPRYQQDRQRDLEIQKLQDALSRKKRDVVDNHNKGANQADMKKHLQELTKLQQRLLDIFNDRPHEDRNNHEDTLNQATLDFLTTVACDFDRSGLMDVLDDHFERHRCMVEENDKSKSGRDARQNAAHSAVDNPGDTSNGVHNPAGNSPTADNDDDGRRSQLEDRLWSGLRTNTLTPEEFQSAFEMFRKSAGKSAKPVEPKRDISVDPKSSESTSSSGKKKSYLAKLADKRSSKESGNMGSDSASGMESQTETKHNIETGMMTDDGQILKDMKEMDNVFVQTLLSRSRQMDDGDFEELLRQHFKDAEAIRRKRQEENDRMQGKLEERLRNRKKTKHEDGKEESDNSTDSELSVTMSDNESNGKTSERVDMAVGDDELMQTYRKLMADKEIETDTCISELENQFARDMLEKRQQLTEEDLQELFRKFREDQEKIRSARSVENEKNDAILKAKLAKKYQKSNNDLDSQEATDNNDESETKTELQGQMLATLDEEFYQNLRTQLDVRSLDKDAFADMLAAYIKNSENDAKKKRRDVRSSVQDDEAQREAAISVVDSHQAKIRDINMLREKERQAADEILQEKLRRKREKRKARKPSTPRPESREQDIDSVVTVPNSKTEEDSMVTMSENDKDEHDVSRLSEKKKNEGGMVKISETEKDDDNYF